jgi:fatty-acyl-CoA synthase
MDARRHTLGDLLRRSAIRHPDKLAIVDGDLRQTYAELDATVNATARALAARGLGRGDRLALLSRNSHAFVVVTFAAAKLGAILVPINFMLTGEEAAYVLEHSGASGIVAEDELLPTAERALAIAGGVGVRGVIGAPAEGWEDVAAWMAHPDASEPEADIADDDPLQLLYTSGTESRPKGAIMTSRSLIAQYVSAIVDGEMTAEDVEVHALPLFHCAQLHCFLTPDLYLGATSVILPGPDPDAILAAIERERATKLFCPPTVWIALLRHAGFDGYDLSSLRKGYYGAAIMPVEVLEELRRRLPAVRLFNFYGQTEMAPVATILGPGEQLTHAGSAGRAALNVETRVVDDDDRPVAPGTVGEIVHRSPHATLGYWNAPEQTAAAYRNGWFHSGDLGVMDADGYLTVVDRKKDMIKTGGENVASREVEEVVYGHAGVAEAAVFGIAHPYWIEAVTAVVVPRDGEALDRGELIAHCRERLAAFKVPKYVAIADALPKNPSGKILKRELRVAYGHLAMETGPGETTTTRS